MNLLALSATPRSSGVFIVRLSRCLLLAFVVASPSGDAAARVTVDTLSDPLNWQTTEVYLGGPVDFYVAFEPTQDRLHTFHLAATWLLDPVPAPTIEFTFFADLPSLQSGFTAVNDWRSMAPAPGWDAAPIGVTQDLQEVYQLDFAVGSLGYALTPGRTQYLGFRLPAANGLNTVLGSTDEGTVIGALPHLLAADGALVYVNDSFSGVERWVAQLTTADACDFDGDGNCHVGDLDALQRRGPLSLGVSAIGQERFDLNADGFLTLADQQIWLASAAAAQGLLEPYLPGDANLDGVVDASDFNVWNAHKFSSTPDWSAGNFSGDAVVDSSDFNLWNAHKFRSSRQVVPEPHGFGVWCSVLLAGWLCFGDRRSHADP